MGMFTETPLFDDPSLPTGWYRKVVQRQTGATAGQWDVYVYNPEGKKFRSRNELRAYLTQIGSSLNSEDFDFSVKGKGHHNKDGHGGSTSAAKEQKKAKAKAIPKTHQTPGETKKVAVKRKLIEKKKADADNPLAKKVIKSNAVRIVSNLPEKSSVAKPSPKFEPPLDLIPSNRDPRVSATWDPPRSPYRLVQEYLYKDPWKLLVATIFLNRTTGKAANPLIWDFFRRWPSPEEARQGSLKEMAELINPLGLHELRARRIIKMSENYLDKQWELPSDLCGISKYGEDSYRMFCLGQWREVNPTDIMLKLYQDWLFTNYKVLKLEN